MITGGGMNTFCHGSFFDFKRENANYKLHLFSPNNFRKEVVMDFK